MGSKKTLREFRWDCFGEADELLNLQLTRVDRRSESEEDIRVVVGLSD